ncbi:hypothetical protein H2200_011931 [Cladophialophora chaetospira]|uniref:Uncharacterized protein n=1 Tax=Cladophialophora chaetospira TaxID=386627 RepID=A0AA38WZ07_9EURO|nr:hypothetical protein H2200_011931 [Cladophialophora chaetospira]
MDSQEEARDKNRHPKASSGSRSSIFSRVKKFFTEAPKMPSNRTAAVAYAEKLKDPKHTSGAVTDGSQSSGEHVKHSG